MVKADLKDLCRRRVGGDMTAELAVCAISANDHGQGVPAHEGGETLLYGDVARMRTLVRDRDGVAVGGIRGRRRC